MAGTYHFRFDQGATIDRLLTWTDGDGGPVDVSGWSAAMQVRSRPGGTLLALLSTGDDAEADGTITLGATAGTIRLLVEADVTAAWSWDRGVYDLLLEDPDGKATRLLEGAASLSPAVTV